MKTPMHIWQCSLKYTTLLRLSVCQMKLLDSAYSHSHWQERPRWFHSFKGNSLKTWGEVVEKFLKKYFIESKTMEGKATICSFHQFPDESLSEALERFKGLLRRTPTHGFSEPIQLNMFIDGLRPQTKQLLDAFTGEK